MRTFVILAFLAVLACAAHAQDTDASLAAISVAPARTVEVAEPDTAVAATLLGVDAGAEHSNESPREARQYGFGGFGGGFYPRPYYGGGYGGGFYRPYYGGGYGGGFYRPSPFYGGYYGGYRGGYFG